MTEIQEGRVFEVKCECTIEIDGVPHTVYVSRAEITNVEHSNGMDILYEDASESVEITYYDTLGSEITSETKPIDEVDEGLIQ